MDSPQCSTAPIAMPHGARIFVLLAIVFCAAAGPARADDAAERDFFESKIRPVLIRHCYECHSEASKSIKGGLRVDTAAGLRAGGDSGPAVVERRPDKSLILAALRYDGYEMPPAGKLPDAVIGDFERWISLGAVDPRTEDVAVPQPPRAIDIAAGRSHWAFQAVETRDAPQVRDAEWSRTWIDRFVLAKLETAGIRPQADADRATLFRRLSFDLVGLPPSEADMQEVLADPGADAIERGIDRLLAAPQFGEHWGRHWLDVVRYADSNGGDYNATFHDAWRYRNYVIDAFNADRPFDALIREQIAGDLLPAAGDAEGRGRQRRTGYPCLRTR